MLVSRSHFFPPINKMHKSVQYLQERMKIEGGGPGGGGVAYPPVMEKIRMV